MAIVKLVPGDYQKQARNYQDPDYGRGEKIYDAALGIASEAGEVAHAVRELEAWEILGGAPAGTEKALDGVRRELILELGDVLWYAAEMCDALGVEIGDVMAENIRKLERRWPNGYRRGEEGER